MSANTIKLRPRRGSKAEWESANPILLEGEIGIEYPNAGIGSGAAKIKLGDGITRWNDLRYSIEPGEASTIHGGDVNTHNEITIRTDTHDNWLASDPVLAKGEIVYDSTNSEIKVGDGVHTFSNLHYIGETWDTDVIYDFGDYDEPDSL